MEESNYHIFQQDRPSKVDFDIHQNFVDYSSYKNIPMVNLSQLFSIKITLKGTENYYLNNKLFKLQPEQVLITNPQTEGKIYLPENNKEYVNGTCIFLEKRLMQETYFGLKNTNEIGADFNAEVATFENESFSESLLAESESANAVNLKALKSIISSNPFGKYQFEKEFFYTLAEGYFKDVFLVQNRIKSIKALKNNTKKEIYFKIMLGKSFIDSHYTNSFSVADVAKQVSMSEFQFFRSFKAVFLVSPYQYLKSKRLDFAKSLLEKNQFQISEIAEITGFNDIHCFSKAFKKQFHHSPSVFKNLGRN